MKRSKGSCGISYRIRRTDWSWMCTSTHQPADLRKSPIIRSGQHDKTKKLTRIPPRSLAQSEPKELATKISLYRTNSMPTTISCTYTMNNIVPLFIAHPVYFALAVYHTPSESEDARAYFISSLSRSLLSSTMSARNGEMSSAFQRARVRKRSVNRVEGSGGSVAAGK